MSRPYATRPLAQLGAVLRAVINAVINAVLCALASAPAQAAAVNWIGASSFWDLATNWSSNPSLPGAGDDVVIDVAGQRTITVRATGGPFAVRSLVLSGDDILAVGGGTLAVSAGYAAGGGTSLSSGTLQLDGTSSSAGWSQVGGVLSGAGTLSITGSATLAGAHTGSGSTVLKGSSTITGLNLDAGRVLRNEGTVVLTGGMNLNPANNSGAGRIDNAVGGVFDVRTFNLSIVATASADIDDLPGFPAINNAGTFRKSAGGGSYGIGVLFNNTGLIDVQVGGLSFSANSTHAGAVTLSAGATLALSAGTHDINAGASFSGPGTLALGGAGTMMQLNAPTTIASAYNHSGGTLQGADLALTGVTTLAATSSLAVMAGSGTTRLQGDTTIASYSLDAGRVLRNEALTTVVGSIQLNRLATPGSGSIVNATGALIDIRTFNNAIAASNNGVTDNGLDAVFSNAGVLRKSTGSGSYGVAVTFDNLAGGVIDVLAGSLSFSGGGSQSGSVTLASGTALVLAGGAHTVNAGASFSGAGTLTVSGAGTVVELSAPKRIDSAFSFTGGTIQGADLQLTGPVTLGISSSLGMMSGDATTTLLGNTTMGGPNAFGMDAKRVLRNEGNLLLVGSIQLNRTNAIGAGRIENAASGVIDVQTFNLAIASADQGVLDRGLDARFDNAGLLKKSTGVGSYTIAVPVFNTGTVWVQAGAFNFSGGLAGQSGTIHVSAGTNFTVAGTLDNHGVLQGEGTITAANIINHGVVAPGQSPGTLTLAAAFVQASDGRLAIELASTASFDSLVVSGTSALGGTLELSAYGGYVPTVGDSFLILTSTGALSGSFSGSPLLFGFAPGVAFGVAYDYAAHTVRLNVLAVPEPATLALWLVGIGLIGLIGLNGAAGGDRRDRHP